MLQLHLSYQQFYCLLRRDLYQRFYGSCGWVPTIFSLCAGLRFCTLFCLQTVHQRTVHQRLTSQNNINAQQVKSFHQRSVHQHPPIPIFHAWGIFIFFTVIRITMNTNPVDHSWATTDVALFVGLGVLSHIANDGKIICCLYLLTGRHILSIWFTSHKAQLTSPFFIGNLLGTDQAICWRVYASPGFLMCIFFFWQEAKYRKMWKKNR